MAGPLALGYGSCWYSCTIGWALGVGLVLFHYFRGKWKTASLVKNGAEEADT